MIFENIFEGEYRDTHSFTVVGIGDPHFCGMGEAGTHLTPYLRQIWVDRDYRSSLWCGDN